MDGMEIEAMLVVNSDDEDNDDEYVDDAEAADAEIDDNIVEPWDKSTNNEKNNVFKASEGTEHDMAAFAELNTDKEFKKQWKLMMREQQAEARERLQVCPEDVAFILQISVPIFLSPIRCQSTAIEMFATTGKVFEVYISRQARPTYGRILPRTQFLIILSNKIQLLAFEDSTSRPTLMKIPLQPISSFTFGLVILMRNTRISTIGPPSITRIVG